MGWLTLAESDRERYDLPDRVPFDINRFGMRSIGALERQTGYSLEYVVNEAFTGRPMLDEHGQQVYQDVLDDEGKPVLDGAGNPTRREAVKQDKDAVAALLWLILWQAGYKVPWDSFDPNPVGLQFDFSEEAATESPGKATTATSSTTTAAG